MTISIGQRVRLSPDVTYTAEAPEGCGTVYEVIIAKDQRSGFPAGLWVRLCYLPMARSVVERLASEGVKASIQACVGVQ